MSELYTWCFACGKDNPIGLKLEFSMTDESYQSRFTAGPEHQSYNGLVHGGIISTILDEIMAGFIHQKTGQSAFTAKLEIRYRQPTPIGQELTAIGRIEKHKGRLYEMSSVLKLPDGTITAEGTAKVLLAEEAG